MFFGEVLGQSGVVLAGGAPDGVQFNTFRSLKTGRRVCVLTNSRMEERRLAFSSFERSPGGAARIHAPGEKSRDVELPAAVVVPAERIVFVEEKGGLR